MVNGNKSASHVQTIRKFKCTWYLALGMVAALLIPPPLTASEVGSAEPNKRWSVARHWNEATLSAIRKDHARPTVHARNLFHVGIALYDAWAVYDRKAKPYLLGRTMRNGFHCPLRSVQRRFIRAQASQDRREARETAMSHAAYRLLQHRFHNSPGAVDTLARIDELFLELGLDANDTQNDLSRDLRPATVGNAIANCLIEYGKRDGANELEGYQNHEYRTVNPPLDPRLTGNPGLQNASRWQPLQFDAPDDSPGATIVAPEFLSAEWYKVQSFALKPEDVTKLQRDDAEIPVYFDPGAPPGLGDDPEANLEYQWNHSLVALWSSHLDPDDEVRWDISPASVGNTVSLPTSLPEYIAFYDALEGGVPETGHAFNPVTRKPYVKQWVKRGDFTRVLAEFWADGPDSETPPGHWFRIYNEAVSDHHLFERRFAGTGRALNALEFDSKLYFLLGATMHDSAVAIWSIKAGYDYIRPLSSLRHMAGLGQSSDPTAGNYNVQGVPLIEGQIESIKAGDVLAGDTGANIGRIKVRAWRGPTAIDDPESDVAGVGWILLENWWPYQRVDFVTPPFAGYVSGHSAFSRAAAEILTLATGDAYFPGGIGEFHAPKDDFLDFERGPSEDVTLQWATYRDAADQTSLSRIWGGIHPPVDDIPGRRLGSVVAARTWERAQGLFDGSARR